MELWEFNKYIISYKNRLKDKEKNIIKLAYYTASFNNAKKTKSLKYYLNQIDNIDTKTNKEDEKKKIEFARKMDEKIKNLKDRR